MIVAPPSNIAFKAKQKGKLSMLSVSRVNGKLGISPVCYYRAHLLVKTIGKRCKDIETSAISSDDMALAITTGVVDMFRGMDMYVLPRLHETNGFIGFRDYVHSWGGKIVYDTDDDLTDDYRRIGDGERVRHTAKHSDHVTVSTPYLAARMQPIIGYTPSVLPNHIDFPWFRDTSMKAERNKPNFTVGFVGTSTHYNDWKYPVDALVKLAEKHPNIIIGVAGYVPDYLQGIRNGMAIEPVPYSTYPCVIRQFDVVCCSLDPYDEFNKCKSAIKAIESMAAGRKLNNGRVGGAVPVCTDMPVYRRVVNNRNNGILVDNDEWFAALDRLVTDRAFYNKLSERGHKWVAKNRDMNLTGWRKWAAVYRRVIHG